MASFPALWIGMRRWREYRGSLLSIQWDDASRVFDWGPAFVRLPPGFTHRQFQGIDTMVGRFVSSDGRTVIRYDKGCANFFLSGETPEEFAAIEAISRSFQPRNRLPAFVMPLLPGPIRRDCRHRPPDFGLF